MGATFGSIMILSALFGKPVCLIIGGVDGLGAAIAERLNAVGTNP